MIAIRHVKFKIGVLSDRCCNNPTDLELTWHCKHGAVYDVFRNDRHVATVWLSLLPEGMCFYSYQYHGGLGKELITAAEYVLQWLSQHYTCIFATIDQSNKLSRKFARRVGFVELYTVNTEHGRLKTLVHYSPEK